MNSKTFKSPKAKIEPPGATISDVMLLRKLEAWCESEPTVLMWEIGMSERMVRAYRPLKELEDANNKDSFKEISQNWRVEFQFVRASSQGKDGLFDGVNIVAGSVKSSLEIRDGQSCEAYLLTLNAKTLRGEKTCSTATELWQTITSIGQRKPIGR